MENEAKSKVKLPPLGQVGVMVKDLDKAVEYYSSTFGMGPWRIVDFDFAELKVRDKIYPWKVRAAFTNLGPVEIEIFQTLAGRSTQMLHKKAEK